MSEHPPLVSENLPPDHHSGFVAVVGKPNVGKSTLINALLGQKVSIVSPKPQTTRRNLLGILTADQYQIVFVDTPGIHKPLHQLGKVMVDTARSAIADADVVLWMMDASSPPDEQDRAIAGLLPQSADTPVVGALNKIDLVSPDALEARTAEYSAVWEFTATVAVSATRGDNRDKLLELLVALLPVGPRYFPEEQVTDADERFIAAELVREQVLEHLRQEVPHAVAVIIDDFRDRSEDLSYIAATIVVERDSQKQITIGKNGSMLKRIGSAARKEIEEALGRKVYLELWVKVIPRWRRDVQQLRRMGFVAAGKQR
jgi:GTP-binding protein Era